MIGSRELFFFVSSSGWKRILIVHKHAIILDNQLLVQRSSWFFNIISDINVLSAVVFSFFVLLFRYFVFGFLVRCQLWMPRRFMWMEFIGKTILTERGGVRAILRHQLHFLAVLILLRILLLSNLFYFYSETMNNEKYPENAVETDEKKNIRILGI